MVTTNADPALLLARRTCYRFLASALVDPRVGTFEELTDPATRELVAAAAEIVRDQDAAVARPLARGERPLADLDPSQIFERLPDSADALNKTYESAFGLLGGSKCPPYETEYVPGKFTFQRSNMLADVAGFYHAFGLQTSVSHPDRPDHVALECAFLAQLILLQLQASQGNAEHDRENVEICQRALRRFLEEHVIWWMPAFAQLLGRQSNGGFYEGVAHFLSAFVAAERACAGICALDQPIEPSRIERPDECSGCQLSID
jgi:TorA maturation chaperone TorD